MSDSGREPVGRIRGGSESRVSGDTMETTEEDLEDMVVVGFRFGLGWVCVRVRIRLRKDQEEERALRVLCLREGEE